MLSSHLIVDHKRPSRGLVRAESVYLELVTMFQNEFRSTLKLVHQYGTKVNKLSYRDFVQVLKDIFFSCLLTFDIPTYIYRLII